MRKFLVSAMLGVLVLSGSALAGLQPVRYASRFYVYGNWQPGVNTPEKDEANYPYEGYFALFGADTTYSLRIFPEALTGRGLVFRFIGGTADTTIIDSTGVYTSGSFTGPLVGTATYADTAATLQGEDTTALWDAKTLRGRDTTDFDNAKLLQTKDTTNLPFADSSNRAQIATTADSSPVAATAHASAATTFLGTNVAWSGQDSSTNAKTGTLRVYAPICSEGPIAPFLIYADSNATGFNDGNDHPIGIIRSGWGSFWFSNFNRATHTQYDSTYTGNLLELGQEGISFHLTRPNEAYTGFDRIYGGIDPTGRLYQGNSKRISFKPGGVNWTNTENIGLEIEDDGIIEGALRVGGNETLGAQFVFDNSEAKSITVEGSNFVTAGRSLTIEAGSATDTGGLGWTSLGNTDYWNNGMVAGGDGYLYSVTAAATAASVRRSTDGGATWTNVGPSAYILSIAATADSNIYLLKNDGTFYVMEPESTHFYTYGAATLAGATQMVAAPNDDIYLVRGASSDSIYKSTDRCATIDQVDSPFRTWITTAADTSGNIYATEGNDLWRSDDAGATWDSIAKFNTVAIMLSGSNYDNSLHIFQNGLLQVSTDSGTTWAKDTAGIGQTYATDVNYCQTSLELSYLGLYNGDVYTKAPAGGADNLTGGPVVFKTGAGKGTGLSSFEIWTCPPEVSGTTVQTQTLAFEVTGTAVGLFLPDSGTYAVRDSFIGDLARIGGTIVAEDSGLTFTGEGQYWQDLSIGALAMRPGVSSPTLAASGAAGGLRNYGFSASAANEVEFNAQTQHGQNESMLVHVHWMPTTTGDTGHVVWGLEYSVTPIDSTMRTVDTLWGEIAGADTGAVVDTFAWKHHKTHFVGTIICPDNSLSNIIICRLFRLGTHDDDTYAQPAQFLSCDFHVKFTRPGSRQETEY